ncbi:MAG: phosphatase PAP2 family protein [Leptolyngbyaceae cyanobacterium RU_5_1]|nr:phosphatase PAP2 family protein [Leptolyngbyaceae cyanobacterium RU_5_1]
MSESSCFKPLQSFVSFFKRWLSTHWRSLLVLFFGIYLPLQIFLVLALQVWRLGAGGLSWDVSILLAIHATVQERLDVLALRLTQFGTHWGVFPASIALMLVLLFLKQWRSLTYLLITLPGSVLINRIGKEFLHRARPHLWESTFPPEPEFAFPSGHAMSSMTFVAALVILTWGSRWCWLVAILGGLFVGAIGWTRLYLGVHYPSDILAGWMMALAWGVGVNWVLNLGPNTPTTVAEEQAVEEAIHATRRSKRGARVQGLGTGDQR